MPDIRNTFDERKKNCLLPRANRLGGSRLQRLREFAAGNVGRRSHDPTSRFSVNPYNLFYSNSAHRAPVHFLSESGRWALGAELGMGTVVLKTCDISKLRPHLGSHVRESHPSHDTSAPSPYPGTRLADGRSHKRAPVPRSLALVPPPWLTTPSNNLTLLPNSQGATHPCIQSTASEYRPESATRSSTSVFPLTPVRCATAGHQEAVAGVGFVNQYILLMHLL